MRILRDTQRPEVSVGEYHVDILECSFETRDIIEISSHKFDVWIFCQQSLGFV